MDSLIKSLEVFAINKDEKKFSDNLDVIMGNLTINNLKSEISNTIKEDTEEINEEEANEEDAEREWEILKSDYSKIKYISQLLNHYHYILPAKFFTLLKVFTDSLDKTTNIYIGLMDDDYASGNCDEELRHCYKKIKKYFQEALETKNDVSKVEKLLKGYDILIPIIEDFRKEKYYDNLDLEFKETYNPKRLKK